MTPVEPDAIVVLCTVPADSDPEPLAALKAEAEFASSPLVRQGRLSVLRLTAAQAAIIKKLGEDR